MKKYLAMILCVCMLAVMMAGCGNSSSSSGSSPTAAPAEEPAKADEAPAPEAEPSGVGKLIVGFDAEFPPYGFIAEDGSYDGFDLAMTKEVCDRLGWEFEAVAIDWDSKDFELSSGNINCIWNSSHLRRKCSRQPD